MACIRQCFPFSVAEIEFVRWELVVSLQQVFTVRVRHFRSRSHVNETTISLSLRRNDLVACGIESHFSRKVFPRREVCPKVFSSRRELFVVPMREFALMGLAALHHVDSVLKRCHHVAVLCAGQGVVFLPL